MATAKIPAGAIVIGEDRHEVITVRGGEFTMLMNPPLSLLAEIDAGGSRTLAGLRTLIVAHPIVHPDGRPADVGAIRDLALVAEILKAWREAVKGFPPA